MSATSTTPPQTGSSAAPTNAPPRRSPGRVLLVGLLIAVVSAATFGSSGAVAKSLLVEGWSPGAAVTLRIAVGALLLAPFALWEMRGRWHLLRSRLAWTHLGLFGLVAVAGCQLFYFLAVERLSVGVALMLEYLGPILVVGWLWLARGQRPRPLTIGGLAIAVVGLLLVLDVLGDVQLSTAGVLWGLAAAVGLAVFFVVGADDASGLPPMAFACFGMTLGGLALLLAGLAGLVPMTWDTAPAVLAGATVPWWVPVLWLGIVAAGLAYATGIAAARALGAKVSSFVGLTEVMFAVLWAWILLAELPAPIQLAGGLLILAGVVCVKLDEPTGAVHAETGPIEVEPIPDKS
ncbi:EamA family transporter [Ornithinimicrobium pratense]|uniref:EamA family transporter n=1 Tax=Ornithinimicrobium pratense TaxID=2593973 RepID=A0A5J6V9G3_9MICO|nr:EamA family transporter [Ornithinimicrobium pratense]QFG69836.1 EamA family transporter [Ornithinimicrobium pratense]